MKKTAKDILMNAYNKIPNQEFRSSLDSAIDNDSSGDSDYFVEITAEHEVEKYLRAPIESKKINLMDSWKQASVS